MPRLFYEQEALAGAAPLENRNAERVIQWNGLRAALNAAAIRPQQRAATEEAFTLLVRFGQASVCGTVLESFARNAEELWSTSSNATLAAGRLAGVPDTGLSGDNAHVTTTVSEEAGTVEKSDVVGNDSRPGVGNRTSELGQSDRRPTAPALGASQDGEPSSVFLGAGEITALATDLDPMNRVFRAFTVVGEAFGGDDASVVVATTGAGGRQRRRPYYRSPLHSYAVARRCRSWKDRLETVGDHLATTRRMLGRRGQDLLLPDSRLATGGKVSPPLPAVMSADELIAQAEAIRSTAARRQLEDEDGSGGGGADRREGGGFLTARINRCVPLFDRSARGIRAFEGQGYRGRRPKVSRKEEGAGESVVVLEVSPAVRSRRSCTYIEDADGSSGSDGGGGNGGGGGNDRAIGNHLAFAASALSIRPLREQPGLMNFYPGAVVVEDNKIAKRSGTAGEMADKEGTDATDGTALPVRVVCERLEGWRPLSVVMLEHGPLAKPSDIATGDGGEGLRVLRLWGGQLASALESLASASLVLRDLRASTVFVSPDGSTVKIVAFFSLTTFSSDCGSALPLEAPALDGDIHGPTAPLTPPEALTTTKEWGRGGVSDKRRDSGVHQVSGPRCRTSLALADSGGPGAFPLSAAWDVWTLGVLLFELAFGHPPPAYGDCLRQGLSTWASDNPATTNVPDLAEMANEIQFDFLSAVSGHHKGGETGIGFPTSDVDGSPLEKALRCASLGAAIGGRDPFRMAWSVGDGEAPSASGRNDDRKSVETFRRAWVRRQLQMEESGETGVTTWQEFQEKVRAHLEVSVASATSAATSRSAWQAIGGGDEGGGRRRIDTVDRAQGAATAPSSSKRGKRAAVEAAIHSTAARLREADSRGTGRIPFFATRGIMRDELQLCFSASEADLLAFCLRDAGGPEDGVGGGVNGGDGDGRGQNDRRDVSYLPIVQVLRAASPPAAAGPSGGGSDPSLPPTPAAFVEVLCACLEPNPQRRPPSGSLLGLSCFSPDGDDGGGKVCFVSRDRDLMAASAYLIGTANELSPALILHERVEQRINTLEAASSCGLASSFPATHPEKRKNIFFKLDNTSSTAERRVRRKGNSDISANFGAGMLVEALKELERLVHRLSPAAHHFVEDGHHMQARRMARGHVKVVGEIFESGVLTRATALALKFLDQEEVRR